MPLSEEELRLLEQMERALVEEDPKLANTLRGTGFRRATRRRVVVAGVVFVGGVALLMTGAIAQIPVVGILGFVVMLASATVAITAVRAPRVADPGPFQEPSKGPKGFSVIDGGRTKRRSGKRDGSQRGSQGGSFMSRMEERWRRRRETGY